MPYGCGQKQVDIQFAAARHVRAVTATGRKYAVDYGMATGEGAERTKCVTMAERALIERKKAPARISQVLG